MKARCPAEMYRSLYAQFAHDLVLSAPPRPAGGVLIERGDAIGSKVVPERPERPARASGYYLGAVHWSLLPSLGSIITAFPALITAITASTTGWNS